MKLLFITQKLHQQDAFGVLWIEALRRKGYDVHVLCLERDISSSFSFPVTSMGKERGAPKLQQILNFFSVIMQEKYDCVFIHMSPVWYAFGFWYWLFKGIPVYLWYTHYKMQLGVRLFGFFGKRFFCATPQSLPQYNASPKKIVTGHGIDLSFWQPQNNVCSDPKKLLVVHRLSRSKRLELSIRALHLLPHEYSMDVYGIAAEKDYVQELYDLVRKLQLQDRVRFHGTVPMNKLQSIYVQHSFILNMASETIDKTMLEAMTCGCYPITTSANAQAIGIPLAPVSDTPQAIADCILQNIVQSPLSSSAMYAVVAQRHSLDTLIEHMDRYIRSGE